VLQEPFGPIEAADLIGEDGKLAEAHVVSNAIKRSMSLRSGRRSLIVGRKGSGKTTLLHMRREKRSVSTILDIGGEFPTVVDELSKEARTRYTEPAARIWSAVIWNTVILECSEQLGTKIEELDRRDKDFLKEYVANLEDKVRTSARSTFSKKSEEFSARVNRGL